MSDMKFPPIASASSTSRPAPTQRGVFLQNRKLNPEEDKVLRELRSRNATAKKKLEKRESIVNAIAQVQDPSEFISVRDTCQIWSV